MASSRRGPAEAKSSADRLAPPSGPSANSAAMKTRAAAPWLPSMPAIDLAIATLPLITDATTSRVVTELAMTVVDQREQLAAVRTTMSIALTKLTDQEAKKKRALEARDREREGLATHSGARA